MFRDGYTARLPFLARCTLRSSVRPFVGPRALDILGGERSSGLSLRGTATRRADTVSTPTMIMMLYRSVVNKNCAPTSEDGFVKWANELTFSSSGGGGLNRWVTNYRNQMIRKRSLYLHELIPIYSNVHVKLSLFLSSISEMSWNEQKGQRSRLHDFYRKR